MKTKKELRRESLQLRDALNINERKIKSHQIAEKIYRMEEFIGADIVLLFASYQSEVDTSEIFMAAQEQKKIIYYPKVHGKEMEFYQVQAETDLLEGYRGIREPEEIPERKLVPHKVLDEAKQIFVLMPGAVFDEEGNRIGYGGGYYDKYLQRLDEIVRKKRSFMGDGMENGMVNAVEKKQFYTAAVAFECQMTEPGTITKEAHDITMDYIVTEHKKYKITKNNQ